MLQAVSVSTKTGFCDFAQNDKRFFGSATPSYKQNLTMQWIEIHNQSQVDDVPSKELFELWIGATLRGQAAEIGIQLVDEDEIKRLNHVFRGQRKVTDILSFPYTVSDDRVHSPHQQSNTADSTSLPYLGDIAICVPQLQADAKQLDKTELEHWAHLTIHATLHLLGYDHENLQDQQEMEQAENDIMQELQYSAPWSFDADDGFDMS